MAVLPLAGGIGQGSLTDPATLQPAYRNAMLICAGLMVGASIVAAALMPARLPGQAPPGTGAERRGQSLGSFCDPAAPPIRPHGR